MQRLNSSSTLRWNRWKKSHRVAAQRMSLEQAQHELPRLKRLQECLREAAAIQEQLPSYGIYDQIPIMLDATNNYVAQVKDALEIQRQFEEDEMSRWEPDDFEVYNQNEADDYRHEGDDDSWGGGEDW